VAGRLERRWSPGQISRWLRRRYPRRPEWHVCTETIYEAVYRGLIVPPSPQLLRTARTYRHRRGRGRSRDGALRQCTTIKPIWQRPAAAGNRRQAGHWEGDLIIGAGQRSAIATLVERKTRYTILVPLPGGHAATPVADALIRAFTTLPAGLRRTLTWDQGNEMFQHARIEQATGLQIYFADPHSPWQRGTNENTNGLLRQYLPKSTDLGSYPRHELDRIAAELNDRPRLCLADRTPAQLVRRWHLPETTQIRDDP
jgi:IS30 family transposase